MKPLPLPVRIAAGLAVTAVDRARHLPEKLAGLPVTMVSQALQLSMRVQQQVTELAIKGDDALSALRPVEESPEWATFDEDATDVASARRSRFDEVGEPENGQVEPLDEQADTGDPWAAEERALARELDDTAGTTVVDATDDSDDTDEADDAAGDPESLPNYAELTLPQVRARMRRLTVAQLTELVDFERANDDRPEFIGMLTRRINTLRDQK